MFSTYTINKEGKNIQLVVGHSEDLFLYVIDGSNPSHILEKLSLKNPLNQARIGMINQKSLSGQDFSFINYNHLIDDKFLFTEGLKENVSTADSAFAMFDISRGKMPQLLFKQVIPAASGYIDPFITGLRYKGPLVYDPAHNAFAIPVVLRKSVEGEIDLPPAMWQGIYLYQFDPRKGFQLKGKISHGETHEFEPGDNEYPFDAWYWEYPNFIKHSLFIGNHLYTISWRRIVATEYDTMMTTGVLDLD